MLLSIFIMIVSFAPTLLLGFIGWYLLAAIKKVEEQTTQLDSNRYGLDLDSFNLNLSFAKAGAISSFIFALLCLAIPIFEFLKLLS